jgi:hypothetical protein
MPTVLRDGPYRFFFYSGDGSEPTHIHVERDSGVAKFWLEPVRLDRSVGFTRAEVRSIGRLVGEHRQQLLEAWNAFFGD